MNVFDLRKRLVDDYASYTASFIKIADARILAKVQSALDGGAFWPEPMLQLNPTFLPGGTVDDLVAQGALHYECTRIFRLDKTTSDHTGKPLQLHTHQREAILKAKEGKSYILTSGTGSGKSLTYIVPIVDHVLRNGSGRGIQAIVVYPMNALANSQEEELAKFLNVGYPEGSSPVRFARYTGQEKGESRELIRRNPPDILLTNYMMLELLLTRTEDRELVRAAQGIKFLVFDELHTYRGRQGADVALLIRRCRQSFGGHDITCVGTSATMASGGSTDEQKREVAKVAQLLFGIPFEPAQVIGETLERATPEADLNDPGVLATLRETVTSAAPPPDHYETFRAHPLASWIESVFGIRREEGCGRLVRQAPRRLVGESSAGEELAKLTGTDPMGCSDALKSFLLMGAALFRGSSSRFPIFAFRLHQFFTRGDTVWATIEPEGERHLEMAKQVAKPGEPDKPLFPLVFCRDCGTAYYRVKVVESETGKSLLPREDRKEEGDDGSGDAYLYLSEASPWPQVEGSTLLDRLPAFMKETSALYRATQQVGPAGLGHGGLSRSVFDAMQLGFDEYAADPEVRGPARTTTNDALRRVIDYYLYRDLQRGWRVTAPNLEDCGLLTFDYEGLHGKDGLLAETELWDSGFDRTRDRKTKEFIETPDALKLCPPALREELLRTLLDVLRRALAVKVDVLDPRQGRHHLPAQRHGGGHQDPPDGRLCPGDPPSDRHRVFAGCVGQVDDNVKAIACQSWYRHTWAGRIKA